MHELDEITVLPPSPTTAVCFVCGVIVGATAILILVLLGVVQ